MPSFEYMHAGAKARRNLLWSPTYVAEAELATNGHRVNKANIEALAQEVRAGNIGTQDTPLLKEAGEYLYTILREQIFDTYGTYKMFDQPALLNVSQAGHFATLSPSPEISVRVARRVPHTHDARPTEVHIYHYASPEHIDFTGGTEHELVHDNKANHWQLGTSEQEFVDALWKPAQDPFYEPFRVVGFARACAAIGFNKLQRTQVGGTHKGPISQIPIPFDFSIKEGRATTAFREYKFMIEALLKRTSGEKYADVDRFLLKHVQPTFGELGVMYGTRNLDGTSRAILAAAEQHFSTKWRLFNGYSLLFAGSRFETMAPRYDLLPHSKQDDKGLTIYALLNNQFRLPHFVYVDRNTTAEKPTLKNPKEILNVPKSKRRGKLRSAFTRDWATGTIHETSIHQPDAAILARAAEILSKGPRNVSPEMLNQEYRKFWF